MKLTAFLFLFLLVPWAWSSVFLNEIRLDQPGGDNDEFIEFYSDAPGSDSFAGLTLIVIGDGAGGSGVIENVTDLSAFADPFAADAYAVVAEASFSIGTADFEATLDFENSDNVTYALVEGFTGVIADDLDTDDDGTLDSTPWSSVVDAVGLHEVAGGVPGTEGGQSTEYSYPLGASIGPDGIFVPGHVYRDGDAPGGWVIGAFDPDGGDDTPGAANLSSAVIPEPSSALLLLLGGGFILGRRRK